MLSESHKIVNILSPQADRFAGTQTGVYVSLENHNLATFILSHKGGTTGKSTLTIQAASSNAGAGATAIPFSYRRKTTGASDTYGAISAATAAGIDTVPTEDTIIELFVKSSDLPDGKPFVTVKAVEAVDDPVGGSVVAILGQSRFKGVDSPSVLS